MESELFFLFGFIAGAIIAASIAVIVAASKRKAALQTTPPVVAAQPAATEKVAEKTGENCPLQEPAGPHPKNTIIIERVDDPDIQLNNSIKEVRDMILRLAAAIASTNSASGKAAKAFHSAKSIIDAIDFDRPDPQILAKAQNMLIQEINQVIKTNDELYNELDKANKGIEEQRKQIEELREQVRVDCLTTIPNRAAFDERLAEYSSLLARSSTTFAALMLDIDHFKRINDVYGHQNGDRILRGVALKISECIRPNDFAARYGGEEFAVVFSGTKFEEATAVAERIRQSIAKTNFRLDDQNIKVTVSGGIAEHKTGMTVENVIKAADMLLYQAKHGGRNRIAADSRKE